MGEICKSKQLFCTDHISFFTIIYIFQLLASSPYGVHQLGREIHRDQVISKLLIKSSFVLVTCEIKIRKMYQISKRIISKAYPHLSWRWIWIKFQPKKKFKFTLHCWKKCINLRLFSNYNFTSNLFFLDKKGLLLYSRLSIIHTTVKSPPQK